MTLTKEWLQQTIEEMEYDKATFPGDLNEDHGNVFEAMKMALAGMEAEPVAWLWSNRKHPSEVTLIRPEDDERAEAAQWSGWSCQALYSAPQPATAVDADDNFYSWFGREWADHYQPNQYTTAAKQMLGVMAESAWKAGRRDAMLQSGNHTEQHLDMVVHSGDDNEKADCRLPFDQWLSQQNEPIDVDCGCVTTEAFYHWLRVAYEAGNSPVTPDGWQLVPKEPTEAMNKAGWAAINEHDAINPTYRAMLAAAPQQDVRLALEIGMSRYAGAMQKLVDSGD
ncbi:hypothetical protein KIP80_22925 [Citrobacter braakii]|nr:hypothetical protein [Citrobacter braakii]